ncbi:hypothetical protein RvY_00365 [Ramazzottius varieornatus]|uniref:Uncharacterized protein n=1 Tax=Ramazzottius varieornatus TaxID=947166 RepID=A0A1D1UGM2_RAMVA|nr:hypothetical protein RvY_00365 [Ramazzottius varieornatus]
MSLYYHVLMGDRRRNIEQLIAEKRHLTNPPAVHHPNIDEPQKVLSALVTGLFNAIGGNFPKGTIRVSQRDAPLISPRINMRSRALTSSSSTQSSKLNERKNNNRNNNRCRGRSPGKRGGAGGRSGQQHRGSNVGNWGGRADQPTAGTERFGGRSHYYAANPRDDHQGSNHTAKGSSRKLKPARTSNPSEGTILTQTPKKLRTSTNMKECYSSTLIDGSNDMCRGLVRVT